MLFRGSFAILIFLFFSIIDVYGGGIYVSKVIDGDTLVINENGKEKYVGIIGVDAPELGQPFAEEAKTFIESVLLDNESSLECKETLDLAIRCNVMYRASNGIFRNLAAVLLWKGLAYYVNNEKKSYNNHEALKSSEQSAKENKKGVWGGAKTMMPWEYRAINKIDESEVAFSRNEAAPSNNILPYVECPTISYYQYDEMGTSATVVSIFGNRNYSTGVVTGGNVYKRASFLQILVKNPTPEDRAILSRDITVTTIKGNNVSPRGNYKFFIKAYETIVIDKLKFLPGITEVAGIKILCR